MLRAGIIYLATCTASAASAETSDLPRATAFATVVWDYVEDRCPAEVLRDPEMNAEIFHMLEMPFDDDVSADERRFEVAGKNLLAEQMTEVDTYSVALAVIGAYGVLHQLEFMTVVADGAHLAEPDYSSKEQDLRDQARTSLDLTACIWPSIDEILPLATTSGRGDETQDMWHQVARSIYISDCNIDLLTLARSFVDADWAAIPPNARRQFSDDLMKQHEAYLEAENVAETCEELS